MCPFQSFALTLEILLFCGLSPCICKCTYKGIYTQDRQSEQAREWMSTHMYTDKVTGAKEILRLYLKGTVHSLVLQSVVWRYRLFCSFSCRLYLIFQIVTWFVCVISSVPSKLPQESKRNNNKAEVNGRELHLSLVCPKEKQRSPTQQHFTRVIVAVDQHLVTG